MDHTIETAIRDVAQYLGVSRVEAAGFLEDAQIALENACDTKEEVDSITVEQVKRMALDMHR